MSKPKMFNRGIVFGSVLKKPVLKRSANKKTYASVQLQCPNDLHGNIRIWGKLWGDQAQDAVEYLKPGDRVRMQGVIQQYDGDYGRVTNFNFFEHCPCTPEQSNDLRAVFVLVADLESIALISGQDSSIPDVFEVVLDYEQAGHQTEKYYLYADTDFPHRLLKPENRDGWVRRVKISGVMRQEEDYFGDQTQMRPYIKEMKVLWEPKEGTESTTDEASEQSSTSRVPF